MKIFLGAVVDGDFLTDTAEELFKKNEVLKVPVMMGITNHEFGWILPQVEHDAAPLQLDQAIDVLLVSCCSGRVLHLQAGIRV